MKTARSLIAGLVASLMVATVLPCAKIAFAKGVDSGETVEYYLYDHLGGVDAVLDEEGNVAERRDYLPFGEERVAEATGTDKERHGFTGKELDDESGLYYYGARHYDPQIGRFTSMDPLALGEAEKPLSSALVDPQQQNAYSYAANSPLRYIDPTGMFNKETGEVEKGDTLGAITETVNGENGTQYSVSDMARLNGIENPDRIFPGQKIIPNGITKDVTDALSDEIEKWTGSLAPFKSENIFNKLKIFKDYSTDSQKMNLKVRPNSVFNITENQSRDYVFEAEKIRYDAPANILYGYIGKYFGFDQLTLCGAAGVYQIRTDMSLRNGIHSPNYGDDPVDTGYIIKGINRFINPILQPK